ncbi:MAG: cytochrome [Hydrocarboniphaga sp.]|uniref:c-type cytochrome n=1 Tax=Hydrocarboniphaga sp. TaxID=2033016 RepID=UPI002622B7FD|nr:cytochrome c [Hydrocarboniphaga sp.]MDB5972208.1 cytochrome [Hydrocarboniphaga sp.]
MSRSHPRLMTGGALLVLAGLSALSSGMAAAADAGSPQAVIEVRQASFKKMGAAMKTIVDQLKTDAPDKARMAAAALVIGSYTAEVRGWFPAGSGAEAGVDTDALPYIWEARAKFDAIADRLAPEAKTMTTVLAGDDMAAVRAQAKTLGGVCSDCHHSFRAD